MKTRIILYGLCVCLLWAGTASSSTDKKQWPEKYAIIYMPVSLSAGRIQTPEFATDGRYWYEIIIGVDEASARSKEVRCMMGAIFGPIGQEGCASDDPLLHADWAIWEAPHAARPDVPLPPLAKHDALNRRIPSLVARGSSDESGCACKGANFRMLAAFPGSSRTKYVADIQFTKDGTALNSSHPVLIVIRHDDFW